MARRSKRKANSLTVGVAGSGTVSEKAIKQHLTEYIEGADTEILWVFPVTDNSPKSIQNVIDFLYEEDASYALVSDGTADDDDLSEHAQWEIEDVEDAHQAVVAYLTEADTAELIILMDEEQDSDHDLVEAAADAEIVTRDLCVGLHRIELEDQEEADDEPEDEDDAEVAEADADTSALPADVLQAIQDRDNDTAVDLLREKSKPELVEVADGLSLAGPGDDDDPWKGIHRKTIATNIVEYVASGVPSDSDEEPEEAPKKKPVKKTQGSKKSKAEKESPAKEEQPEVQYPADTGQQVLAKAGAVNENRNGQRPLYAGEIIGALAHVASEKGADEAQKFLKVLEDAGFVSR